MRGECEVYLFMIIVRTFQFEQSQSVTAPDVKIARRYREEDGGYYHVQTFLGSSTARLPFTITDLKNRNNLYSKYLLFSTRLNSILINEINCLL